jgi:hypothetical protein
MRLFTSIARSDCDDTFEAVLREEFELMRRKFEHQVGELREASMRDKVTISQVKTEAQVEIDKLKVAN